MYKLTKRWIWIQTSDSENVNVFLVIINYFGKKLYIDEMPKRAGQLGQEGLHLYFGAHILTFDWAYSL